MIYLDDYIEMMFLFFNDYEEKIFIIVDNFFFGFFNCWFYFISGFKEKKEIYFL